MARLKVHIPHHQDGEPVVITFVHEGHHHHAQPPSLRTDAEGHCQLDEVVNIALELHPKNLQIGTATCKLATVFHPAYANLDQIADHRCKVLQKHVPGNTLGELSAYKDEIDDDFIQSSSMAQ